MLEAANETQVSIPSPNEKNEAPSMTQKPSEG
jgi:hypothetical protein